MDIQQAIDQMYGQSKKEDDSSSTLLASDNPDEQEDRFYLVKEPCRVGNPYSLESGSREDTLYGGTERVEMSPDTDLSILSGGDVEIEANLKDNLGYIGSEVGVDQQSLGSLIATVNEYLITGGTGESRQEVMRGLYNDYGSDLVSKLSDAQELIASFPEVWEWLESTGAGNDSRIIRQIIRMAQSPRSQKRLETLRRK